MLPPVTTSRTRSPTRSRSINSAEHTESSMADTDIDQSLVRALYHTLGPGERRRVRVGRGPAARAHCARGPLGVTVPAVRAVLRIPSVVGLLLVSGACARAPRTPGDRVTGPVLSLRAIAGSGSNRAWAVGDAGTIVQWNGREWTAVANTSGDDLIDLCVETADRAWAVGSHGRVVRWDGHAWQELRRPVQTALRAVWCTGRGTVWLVGDDAVVLRSESDGSFARVATPSGDWLDVGGTCSDDVWLVGRHGRIVRGGEGRWTDVPSGTHADLYGIAVVGGSDVWIVGSPDPDELALDAQGTAMRWDGHALVATSTGTHETLLQVWGTARADVWAVGQDFGRNGSNLRKPVLHFDGQGWSARSTGATGWYRGIWGDGAGHVWAVGCCEPLLSWLGGDWEALTRGGRLREMDRVLPIGDGRLRKF